jgi:amino acid adenylation domain-containing protein
VLAQVLADPSRSLRSVRLLGEREQRTLIDEYSTGPVVSARACVADRFLAQAERAPDAVALSRNGHIMSYRELRARVLELAGRLRRHGIGAELRVAIFAHRSFELIVGILGALEAGATYVPIDPSDPVERIAFLLDDAAPALVLVQAGLNCPAAVPALALDTCVPVDDARHEPVQRRPGPRDAAYLIYTSGSTGAPRGVLVEHGSLANLVSAQAEAFRAAVGTRVLQFASPSFDASVSEIFVALCHGATLCLASHDELLPGPALIGLLERERIHVLKMPPSALAALPEAPLPDLTTIMAAGECCPEEIVARWSTGRTFVNVYGPTETTVCAALGPCVSGDGTPTVGRPLANVRLYVLDAAGELAPVGVTGELHIAGAGVARGYWNRPDVTAERFLPDRFAGAPARMYRTGDLARWRLDGRLEILGRRDRQLKVRGYRIEPAEIESVLLAHPAVAEAVVGALPGPGGHLRLIGWCVLRPDGSATPAELRAHLCRALPSWMAPALLIAVPRIPRTPHGKVDLRALPADLPRGEIHERDLGEVERAILETWSDALGASADPALTFFEQGGDSLLLVIAHERLQRRLGRHIAIADLLRFPSAPALAAWLELGAEPTPAPRADVRATRRAGQAQLRRTRTSHRDASPEPRDD